MNDNCKKCIHRETYKSTDDSHHSTIDLCVSEPYEEDNQFGIITWLDVKDFDSGECLNFKEV